MMSDTPVSNMKYRLLAIFSSMSSSKIFNQVEFICINVRNSPVYFDCDLFNYNKVQDLSGELHVFPSVDEGDTHYLINFST